MMARSRLCAAGGSLAALIGVLACLAFVASASAAPALGPAGSAFYTPPSALPSGSPGALIWYRPATLSLGSGAPSVTAWDVLYHTSDALGNEDVATGTVIVPTAAWTGSGTRPVIDYAAGTQGLAPSCAPSVQLAAGTEYETANIVDLLQQGWAVVLTDYQGYTTGSQTLFGVGGAEAHAVLDADKAADQIPGSGLNPSTETAIWGYSLGGQAAAWAGQLQPSYDPSMNLVGVAAGGIPGNLLTTANYLNDNVAAGFAAMAILGLSDQYPSAINLSALENATGAAATATIKSQCVFQTLLGFENANIDNYTQGGQTLAQLEAMPSIAAAINAQQLGTTRIPVPLYQYHGQADEIIPLAQDIALKQQYCSEGVPDEFVLYPSEHITTQFQAAPQVITWLSNRFAGQPPPSDCNDTAPQPTSTANPGGGDFIVSLNQWTLNASLTLKTLGDTLNVPPGSTFSGATDLTSQQLQNATTSVPTYTTTLKVLGIPLTATVGLVQDGAATGTASLDTSGNLHINATAQETLQMKSVGLLGINIPLGSCQTSTPVTFALNFNGPVSSLGDGQLKFSGSTAFPGLANCGPFGLFSGIVTPILNLLFKGPGNNYTFTVSPPAPIPY